MSDQPEGAVGRERLIRETMTSHMGILNKLDSHLGCVACRGPLTDGRCPKCQPVRQAMIDLTERATKLLEAATQNGRWKADFTIHGDPYVVPAEGFDKRELMHKIAHVTTSPDDYGRANCELLAEAPSLIAKLVEELRRREAVVEAAKRVHDTEIPIMRIELETAAEREEWYRASDALDRALAALEPPHDPRIQ